jgi:hypothetical protein
MMLYIFTYQITRDLFSDRSKELLLLPKAASPKFLSLLGKSLQILMLEILLIIPTTLETEYLSGKEINR